jgi:hypothetical protein
MPPPGLRDDQVGCGGPERMSLVASSSAWVVETIGMLGHYL